MLTTLTCIDSIPGEHSILHAASALRHSDKYMPVRELIVGRELIGFFMKNPGQVLVLPGYREQDVDLQIRLQRLKRLIIFVDKIAFGITGCNFIH